MPSANLQYYLPSYRKLTSVVRYGSPLEYINRNVIERFDFSRELAHILAPDNYELYVMHLYVVDIELGKIPEVIIAFDFTVMPGSYSKNEKFKSVVKSSLSSNYILENHSFTPMPLRISGNFGMKHKAQINILGANKVSILTGYGLVKRLNKIVQISHSVSKNKVPFKTIFINHAYNEMFEVSIDSFDVSQEESSNGIWKYSLNMTALADAKDLFKQLGGYGNILAKEAIESAFSIVSNTADTVAGNLQKFI